MAQALATMFNSKPVPKKISFVDCKLVSFPKRDKNGCMYLMLFFSIPYVCVGMILEPILTSWTKFSNNKGFVSSPENNATVNAFPHFTHHVTGKSIIINIDS